MTNATAQNTIKARAYLGGCKVCLNCGTVSHPSHRKCINTTCKGTLFRQENTTEASQRLNAYEAEQIALENTLKEFLA